MKAEGNFNKVLCEALGLDSGGVYTIMIKADAGDICRVVIGRFVTVTEGEAITRAAVEYKLVHKDTRTCAFCHDVMPDGRRSHALTCSDRCRSRLNLARRKEVTA